MRRAITMLAMLAALACAHCAKEKRGSSAGDPPPTASAPREPRGAEQPATAAVKEVAPRPAADEEATPPPAAAPDSESACSVLADAVCAFCGEDRPACAAFEQIMQQPAKRRRLAANACGQIIRTMRSLARDPAARGRFCSSSPMAAAAPAQPPAATAPACATLAEKVCAFCGSGRPACARFRKMMADPDGRAGLAPGACTRIVNDLRGLTTGEAKERFCGAAPGGEPERPEPVDPAREDAACVALTKQVCELCGTKLPACGSFRLLTAKPDARKRFEPGACQRMARSLKAVAGDAKRKETFCNTSLPPESELKQR